MNKTVIVCVSLVFVLTIVGGLAWAEIKGSKHDFSDEEWTGGDPCAACHAPDRDEAPEGAPLWDLEADLSRKFGARGGERAEPGQGTLVCLRCHDGTIASERTAGAEEKRFANKEHPGMFSSGHESSEHPVGVEYPQFDKGYRPLIAVVASGTVTLPDGKVECTSCHDPHDMSDQDYMLVASNARSGLCLICHRK